MIVTAFVVCTLVCPATTAFSVNNLDVSFGLTSMVALLLSLEAIRVLVASAPSNEKITPPFTGVVAAAYLLCAPFAIDASPVIVTAVYLLTSSVVSATALWNGLVKYICQTCNQ